jgi:POT family proton-dependent oligopeptide transporter
MVFLWLLIAQGLGYLVFLSGRHFYVRLKPLRRKEGVLGLTEAEWFDLRCISLVIAPLPVFWALYYQQASTWVMQTRRLDLTLVWNTEDILPAFNDLLVVLMIPIFQRFVYPSCSGRFFCGGALGRMTWGMAALCGSFILAALLQVGIDHRHSNGQDKLSVAWQVPQYLLISVSEVMVAVTGLQFVYDEVSMSLHATVEAIWVGLQMGQLLCGVISALSPSLLVTFELCAVSMIATTGVFAALSRRYTFRVERTSNPVPLVVEPDLGTN